MVFFWACEVTETKAAVVKIPEGYVLNVCNATLAAFSADAAAVSLGVETTQMDQKPWKGVVAHLGAGPGVHQVKLDLVFGVAAQVKFYLAKGTGKVNVTGYFQPGPPADLFESEIELADEKSEDEAKPVVVAPTKKNGKKRAREEPAKAPVTWDQAASSDDDDEEEEKKPKETVAKTQPPAKKQAKQQQNEAPKPAAAAPKAETNGNEANGAGKKKKKNRKSNKGGNKQNN